MARQVLSNAVILEGEELEITKGYLIIKDGIIEKISEGSPPCRAKDLKHGFVIPPFVNSHTHVADSVAKERYIGKTQPEVVGPGGEKFKALESFPKDEIVAAIRATLQYMLWTGTLAHCDFREGGEAGVELLKGVVTPPLKSIIFGRPTTLQELPKILTKADGIGLPSLNAFEWDDIVKISRQTKQAKKAFSVHAAETRESQEASLKLIGVGEVERAVELNPKFIVHATHASEREFSLLKKKDIPVVFCLRANNLLGVGNPPIHQALTLGTKFCLGTDNVMVCQPNMFEELSFAWAYLRNVNPTSGSDEARKLLKAATVEPARLFGLPWGVIAENEKATFLVLSRRENLLNICDVYAGLINRARPENIRAIFVNGKII